MYSITFESESKTALEYLRETAYEKIPEMEEMTVEQLDAMIKEPIVRTHITVCNNCGSDSLGTDALVDDNNEVCAGPYDNTQCLYCGDIDASVRSIPINQIRSCVNGWGLGSADCDYMCSFDEKVMKGDLCPMCADPSLETGMVWNLKEND